VSFVVLDTDVASASLRGRLPDPLRTRLVGQTACITFVTLGELTKWTALRDWDPGGSRTWPNDAAGWYCCRSTRQ
jgi:toxin FitB